MPDDRLENSIETIEGFLFTIHQRYSDAIDLGQDIDGDDLVALLRGEWRDNLRDVLCACATSGGPVHLYRDSCSGGDF